MRRSGAHSSSGPAELATPFPLEAERVGFGMPPTRQMALALTGLGPARPSRYDKWLADTAALLAELAA